jgi:hypothetical protein
MAKKKSNDPSYIKQVPGIEDYELMRNQELQGLENVLTIIENLLEPEDSMGLYEENELYRSVLKEILDANR